MEHGLQGLLIFRIKASIVPALHVLLHILVHCFQVCDHIRKRQPLSRSRVKIYSMGIIASMGAAHIGRIHIPEADDPAVCPLYPYLPLNIILLSGLRGILPDQGKIFLKTFSRLLGNLRIILVQAVLQCIPAVHRNIQPIPAAPQQASLVLPFPVIAPPGLHKQRLIWLLVRPRGLLRLCRLPGLDPPGRFFWYFPGPVISGFCRFRFIRRIFSLRFCCLLVHTVHLTAGQRHGHKKRQPRSQSHFSCPLSSHDPSPAFHVVYPRSCPFPQSPGHPYAAPQMGALLLLSL